MQKVANHFKYKKCSAIQIRIGGAKGVCMVKPSLLISSDINSLDTCDIEDVIKKQKTLVQLRPSQIKFPSNNISLDVVKCATFT
jgi:hypothetical protein